MMREPGHPFVGRRFDNGDIGVGQKREQAIDGSEDEVDSPDCFSDGEQPGAQVVLRNEHL